MKIRIMTEKDYDALYELWMSISGFGIRSIDDSREGIGRFLRRNPTTSADAEGEDGSLVGSILCGHDGRTGYFYHVCVREDYRMHGIGKAMAAFCVEALKKEQINKVALIAFTENKVGNTFWQDIGWDERPDVNYYEFPLNSDNVTVFNVTIQPCG